MSVTETLLFENYRKRMSRHHADHGRRQRGWEGTGAASLLCPNPCHLVAPRRNVAMLVVLSALK